MERIAGVQWVQRATKTKRRMTRQRIRFAPLALLVLAALALLLVYARPLTYTVTVGADDDRAAVVNFHGRERNPTGVPYRWSRDRSTLVFHAAGLAFPANRPSSLELSLAGSRPPGVAPPLVAIEVNGIDVGQQAVAGEGRLRLPLGAALAGAVDTRVTVHTETFVPPGDRRELGVAVLGPARLVENPGSGLALPPVGAWWRWLGTVLCGYLVALALARGLTRATVAAVILVLALTGAAIVARPIFWQLIHLPLLVLALALPILWRRELATAAARAVASIERRWGVSAPALVLGGLVPMGAAQALLTAGRAPVWTQPLLTTERLPLVALPLYAAGILVVLAALAAGGAGGAPDETPADTPHPRAIGRGELAALVGILVLAAVARSYRLSEIPAGLWRDEARHGLEALRILREPDYRPVYLPNISLPGLYPAALAITFGIFGASVGALRGLTAAAGVAAVLALFAVTRRLWGPRVALVAALLGAAGSWRVSIDRLAFDTAPTTLCTLLAFYGYRRGVDAVRAGGRGFLAFAGAGLAAGLAIYGYYPGRFALATLTAAAILLLLRGGRPFARRAWPGLILCAAVAGLTLLPLARYALERPDDFFRRSGQVFLLSDRALAEGSGQGQTALEVVERNVVKHLGMFNWRGESNARHHAPGWPMLDGVTALGFALGLALAIVAAIGGRFDHRQGATFALLWLAMLLIPSVVSIDAPSAVRAQDAAPATYALAALGFVALWRALTGTGAPAPLRRAAPALAGATLALAVAINLWLYFLRLPGDPRVLDKFQYVGETRAGRAIAAARDREPAIVAYLPRPSLRDPGSSEVLHFTAGETPLRELPPDGGALPPGPVLVVVPRGEDFERQLAAARRVAEEAGLREVRGEAPPGGGDPAYVAFVRDRPR